MIIKKAFGSDAAVTSIDWSAGGLFNKVYYVNTREGSYILKIECSEIFISTRKDQMKNEVYGSKLVKEAGIPCAEVLAFDLDKKDIGVNYILTERISNDILWCDWFAYTQERKDKIRSEVNEIFKKMSSIKSDYFGSLCKDGHIGWHRTWDACCRAIFELLTEDCERLCLLTFEELSTVKQACTYLSCKHSSTYSPAFNHNDFGRHNTIWGSIGSGPEAVHIIDFGNAMFGLPFIDEFIVYKSGDFDYKPCNVLNKRNLNPAAYEKWLFIGEFEKMLWTASEKQTKDYAHCTDGLTQSIERSKADASRSFILEFINKCYSVLCNGS